MIYGGENIYIDSPNIDVYEGIKVIKKYLL